LAFAKRFYRIVNTGGFVLVIGMGYLLIPELPPLATLGAGVALASLLLAASMVGQTYRLRKTSFLGEYAVTDKRVLCLTMRGALRAMPLDSELSYRIIEPERSGTVEFRHPGSRCFRFGCLAQRDIASLLEVLAHIREASP